MGRWAVLRSPGLCVLLNFRAERFTLLLSVCVQALVASHLGSCSCLTFRASKAPEVVHAGTGTFSSGVYCAEPVRPHVPGVLIGGSILVAGWEAEARGLRVE
jgi:hypothetical protein